MTRSISIPVSIGELFDKITILEIKSEEIKDIQKLKNINKELNLLTNIMKTIDFKQVLKYYLELKQINKKLWNIEDRIRELDREKVFENEFVKLAQSVYVCNDKRSKLKYKINMLLGSNLIEEKSYKEY